MQHTKGSWKIGKNNIVSTKEEYGECRKGHVEIDAPGWGGLIICHRHEINENDNECLANARLISAAPDMLKVLLKLQDVIERAAAQNCVHAIETDEVNMINAAILQAVKLEA